MKKLLPILGKVTILAVFLLAIYLLYHEISKYSLRDIRYSLHQIPLSSLLLSFFLMIINYGVLVGYDWLALKAINKSLPLSRVSLVSFIGQVVSYNFGALLGGSTVRFRLYSSWGFTPLDIVRLVLMLAVTFWVGALGLAGLIFLFEPLDIPPELGLSITDIRPLGAALLSITIAYLVLCWYSKGRSVKIFKKDFSLPSFKIAIAQTIVAGVDLIIAAGCMYALLPDTPELTFWKFVPSYLMAQVAVVLTHVPGGMGVLELVILNLTNDVPTQSVFAALLSFRVIYYLLPLIIAAVLLGFYELHLRRNESRLADVARWFRTWVPDIMAYATFACGVVMCLLSMLPWPFHGLQFFSMTKGMFLPIFFVLNGMAGIVLLYMAHGLQMRKRDAWKICVVTLTVGVFCSLGKGGSLLELALCLAVLFMLVASRNSFGRIAPVWRNAYPWQWMLLATAVFFGIVGGSLFLYGFIDLPMVQDWRERGLSKRIALTAVAQSFTFALLALGYFWKRRKKQQEI